MAKTKTKKTVASPEKEEKKTKKEEYIEQRQEKLAAAREALVSGIKSLETDEDWKKFLNRLTKRSRFSPGRLSFGNQILVYLQFPEATNVATYRSWYRIGRWPIKGSHGIMIFQPRPYMRKTKEEKSDNGNGENGKEYKPTGRMFFKPIYLFDISQTEGKDPPEWLKPPPPPKIDNKEVFKNSVEKLAELIQGLPESPVSKIEIRERKKGERTEVHGWYERDSKIIVVYKIDNRGQMFKTLVHEIAHAMMHAENNRSIEVKEVEAESVAYVVNKALGLDTSDYSFKYVANWSGMKQKADEAIKIIERSGQRIVSTSNMILDVLMPLAELPDEDEKTGSPDTPQPVEEPTRRGKGRPKGSKNKQSSDPQPIDISKLVKKQKKSNPVIIQEPSISEPEQCDLSPKKNLDNIIEFALNNDGYVDDATPNIISFDDKYKASLFRIEAVKNGYLYTEKKEGKDIIFEITCGTPAVTVSSLGEPTVNESKSCKVAESKRGIDYHADTDMNGEPVNPGDYVSFKTYPKGTGRGIVIVSKREMVVLPDGSKLPALAINSDGTIYGYVTGGVKKLKHQTSNIKEPESKQECGTSEPIKRGPGRPKGSKNKSQASEHEPKQVNEPARPKRINQKDYKFYVVMFNKIIAGNEFKEDAKEFIEGNVPYTYQSDCKVYSKNFLKQNGIDPDINENWGNIPSIKVDETSHYRSEEPKTETPTQFKKEIKESKPGLKKETKQEQTNEPKSRKPRSGAYSLKQGTAFELIGGEWDVSITDDEATSTAKPVKRQVLGDSECIIFEDSKGRKWAQTETIARNRNNKRALKQHMLQAQEKSDCVCLGKTSKKAGKKEKDFDKKSIAAGVKVELEHTDDIEIAKRIAMDHLTEDKDYYVKLIKAGL